MDDIEPWNMFSSDFVAEETEELLTDELVAEYGKNEDQMVAAVKQELQDDVDDDSNELIKAENETSNYSRPEEEDPNDNELFNFSLEPEVNVRHRPVVEEDLGNDPPSLQRIDYDCAVIFVCPACGYEMDSHEKWKRHIDFVHKYSTRRGLNFVQVDKLYHQCLECKRKIAMHSMENLIKHKFTHLPYKRAKCRICQKQYKYRQDIMVHLRMSHRDELLSIAKKVNAGRQAMRNENQLPRQPINFEIKNIQENAIDIFENTVDGVEVKSEAIDDDDEDADEQPTSSAAPQNVSTFEESLSRSSSHQSETSMHQRTASGVANKEELCEKLYIQYICPQCGAEFGSQPQWRQHIEFVHNFGTRSGLNFKEVNMKQHAQCLECDKIININVIRNLQIHKFTHLAYKSWLRCKLCFRTFVGHKEIVKHLMTQHRLGEEIDNTSDSQDARYDCDEEPDNGNDSQPSEQPREEKNDQFEPHIDYLCPQCGKEFFDKRLWRKHIVKAHHLTDMKVLNFKVINDRQVMCLECCKIITNAYGVQNAQQHKFTHLPWKSFVRCRLCCKSYTDRKGLVKHLRSRHRLGDEPITSQTTSYSPSLQLQTLPQPVQKEIVKHADFTFEIKYLNDDDDDGDDNDILDDNTPVPELNFSSSFNQFHSGSFKCKQCSLSYTSQSELQVHINDEHEFLDFNNLRPLPEGPRTNYQRSQAAGADNSRSTPKLDKPSQKHTHERDDEEDQQSGSRDDFLNSSDSNNDLLVPTGDEDISSCSQEPAGIERNFCYLCPNCGFECATQMLWRRHINDVHNYDKRNALNFRQIDKFRYQCLQCMDIVSGSKLKGLQDHKFRHLAYKLYIKCLLCSTCYNHKPNMMSHLRQRHNIIDARTSFEGPYEPSTPHAMLPKSFVNKPSPTISSAMASSSSSLSKSTNSKNAADDSLSYHNAVDHESITYFCPMCNENFTTHVYWRKHIVEKHNLNNRQGLNFRQIDEHHFLCLQCYKRVTVTHTKGAIGQLQSHKFRHLPFKSFKCNACNGLFVRKQMFFKHLNKETNLCDSKMCEEEVPAGECTTPTQKPQAQLAKLSVNENNAVTPLYESNFQHCFILICPQCGLQFESQRQWREHINHAHDFIKRETLNFKRVNSNLHECQQCFEHVNGNKLRDLQIHKFKHLPFGTYIQCKYCSASYSHMRNIQDHLKLKHRNILEKNNESFDEITFPEEEAEAAEPDAPFLLE